MLVHPNFDPVAISLGPIAIRWYGIMYLVGFAISYGLGRLRIARAISRGGAAPAPPLAALPVRPRGGAPVRDPVDLFGEAAAQGSGDRGVPPRLRSVPFRRRVLSRAR